MQRSYNESTCTKNFIPDILKLEGVRLYTIPEKCACLRDVLPRMSPDVLRICSTGSADRDNLKGSHIRTEGIYVVQETF